MLLLMTQAHTTPTVVRMVLILVSFLSHRFEFFAWPSRLMRDQVPNRLFLESFHLRLRVRRPPTTIAFTEALEV